MDSVDITVLLVKIREGNKNAQDQLVTALYPDLHAIASRLMRRESTGHSLQTTALLHQAYIRMTEGKPGDCTDRAHFLGFAALVMRNVLIDHARGKHAMARGGPSARKISLDNIDIFAEENFEELLAINEALTCLFQEDPRAARVLETQVFGGLSLQEIAAYVGISERTVKRDISFAKAWLYRRLSSTAKSE
jgi:RNA polymerase sigma-70 factor (ECF subfamily)